MLTAITDTARFTLQKVNAIYQLFQEVIEQIRKEAPQVYSYELVELLFCQPYCKIKFLVDNGIASRNTAGKYLNRLEELGILVKEQMGNESLYLNKQLYDLLLSDSVD